MTDEHQSEQESALRVYEVGYIELPSVPEEHIHEFTNNLKGVILREGGAVISEGEPLIRPLAYEMVKPLGNRNERYKSAYFGWVKFEVSPQGALEIKKSLDAMESLLRFILVKTVREAPQVEKTLEVEEDQSLKDEPSLDKSIEELVIE